jgi:hypothetical protein
MSGFGSITRNPVDSASLCTMWDSGTVGISSASHPSSRHGRSSRPDSLPSQGLLRCYFAPSSSLRVRYPLHVCPCRALHNHANTLLLPDQRYLRSFGFSNEEAMAMVQGQLEHQVEDGTTSRGVLDGMPKQRGYDRSRMHMHIASSRCSSI